MSSCEIILSEQTIRMPGGPWTLASFQDWASSDDCPEQARVTYAGDAVLIDMRPEEVEHHTQVKDEIARVLLTLNRQHRLGKFYGDGLLVTHVEAELSTVPDGTFVLRDTLLSGRARLVPRRESTGEFIELEGTPDIVIEIVSKTSLQKDTLLLRDRYHRAGIAEYWLVSTRAARIDFQILRHRPGGYLASKGRGGWQRSDVLGRRFRLSRQRDTLGLYEDTLDLDPA
jgi:Uma2 family endonuclease